MWKLDRAPAIGTRDSIDFLAEQESNIFFGKLAEQERKVLYLCNLLAKTHLQFIAFTFHQKLLQNRNILLLLFAVAQYQMNSIL